MNSKNSMPLQNGLQLNKNHFKTIETFVGKYDSLYLDLSKLEKSIQEILKKQEAVVNLLEETRNAEELFFKELAKETKKDIQYLKKIASTWVIENK